MLNGQEGVDLVSGGSGDDRIYGGDGNDADLTAFSAGLNGGTGNDVIHGGNGNDRLYGETGDDTMFGDAGDDQLVGDRGNDMLYGGYGRDGLSGGIGGDILTLGRDGGTASGGAGDDTIFGSRAESRLAGGDGSDVITTYGAEDMITGHEIRRDTGFDLFVIAQDMLGSAPTIMDFFDSFDGERQSGIALAGDVFTEVAAGVTDASFRIGPVATDASDRIIFDPSNGNLFYDPDGIGFEPAQLIATLTGRSGDILTAADFTIV